MLKRIARLLRSVADHLDPQPDPSTFWVYGNGETPTGVWTTSASGSIKWRRTG